MRALSLVCGGGDAYNEVKERQGGHTNERRHTMTNKAYTVEVKKNGAWEVVAKSYDKNEAYSIMAEWITRGYMAIVTD